MLCLSLFGLLIVGSATSWISLKEFNDSFYMLKRQAISFFLGLIAFLLFYSFPLKFLKRYGFWIFGCSIALMALLISPFAISSGGSTRWVYIGGFQFQPSEILKIGAIVFLATFFSTSGLSHNDWKKWTIAFFLGLIPVGLIAIEPDLGSAVTLLGVLFILLFAGGMPLKQIAIGAPLVTGGFGVLIWTIPYARSRVLSFLNPGSDPLGTGYNQIQSLIGVKAGGFLGRGLGLSVQKFQWLPQAYNDFIFSILAEEIGFLGVAIFLGLFFSLVLSGLQVGLRSRQPFNSLLAVGISSLFGIQALLHIGVASGALPVTGITLPFLSYGGTSLLVSMACCGILARIAREEETWK
jgi:cell division protein FtsW